MGERGSVEWDGRVGRCACEGYWCYGADMSGSIENIEAVVGAICAKVLTRNGKRDEPLAAKEMAEIATESIEPPDDDHVSLPRRLEEGGEPRAVLTLSGRLVLVDRVVADAGLAQSIPLQVEALGTVRLRYPRVADQHWRLQNDRFCDT